MVDSSQALLLRKSGHDVQWWAEQGRSAGVTSDAELREWMRAEHGITGYAQYAVSWEMFGYPEFMLRDADELLDVQYRDHPNLRPIANTLLAWAAAHPGVAIQMRKSYISLHSSRRKFAQVTRANSTGATSSTARSGSRRRTKWTRNSLTSSRRRSSKTADAAIADRARRNQRNHR